MGTYSYGEYLDTFGGPPEPGETYPDDPDAAIAAERECRRDKADLLAYLEDQCVTTTQTTICARGIRGCTTEHRHA